jgi:hypothetical protein
MRRPRVAARGQTRNGSIWNMSTLDECPKPGNTPIEHSPQASGLEVAMELDRRFFAQHPFLSEYKRELIPGEYPPSNIPREIPASCEVRGSVTVRQIAPGLRMREITDVYFVVTAADLKEAAALVGAAIGTPDGAADA